MEERSSASRLCMQELLDTNRFKVQGSWNLIWKLKVSQKVKKLIWTNGWTPDPNPKKPEQTKGNGRAETGDPISLNWFSVGRSGW